jgi:hypothetical protein
MRNKRFRLKQKAKYRERAKRIVKDSFISRSDYKNNKNSQYDSYDEMVMDIARHHEKNRKRCSCDMCVNARKNGWESDKLTIQEKKNLLKYKEALQDAA